MSRYKVRNLFKFRTKSTTDLSEWSKNDEKLLKNVELGDVKKVNSILNKKTLIPTKLGPKGHSVFHIACAVGNDQIVELLLKYSDDVNDLTIQGNTALQLAGAKGHTGVVQRLLQAAADVDMRDSNDMTALHHACAGVHFECVQALLNGNSSPRSKEKTGKTPLFFASHRGDLAICKVLVDKGADVNAQDVYDLTSLMIAGKEGHSEVCKFLLKKGANPETVDRDGKNALVYALSNGHTDLKEIFARAPTRASWDVHANNVSVVMSTNSTTKGASTTPISEPEPAPVAPDQVDIVDKFDASESPPIPRREVHTDGETEDDEPVRDPLRKTKSESWDGSEWDENASTDLGLRQLPDQKTVQALKELEEEHEQLNEDYHNLTVENRKLYDKIDKLKQELAQQGQAESQQEFEDEVNNLKNLLFKEQEKTQDLEEQNDRLATENQSLSIEMHTLSQHHVQLELPVKKEGENHVVDGGTRQGDSWGDSDEELFDSPTRRRKNRNTPDDQQMVALLRSQILTLRQENDQLKEKMQSLPNGFRDPSPYMFQSNKPESGVPPESGSVKQEQLQEFQQTVVQLEAEKAEMQKEILSLKEKTEFDLLNGAINQEELIVENKRLSQELEKVQKETEEEVKVEPQDGGSENKDSPRSPKSKSVVKEDAEEEEKETMTEDSSRIKFLETQNEHLQDQCAYLSEELEKLQLTFDAILKAGDNLQADFDQLQGDKEQIQQEFERMVQEKDELVKENEFLLSDGNALHEDLKKLVHELEKMQEKYKKVAKEKEDLERKTSAIELSGKVGEFTKLLEVQDKLKARNDELEATSARLQRDQDILLEEVQSMQDQTKIVEVERDQLQAEMEEVESVLQQHDVLQQDYAQLEQDYTELLKDKEKLEQELLDQQKADVKSEMSEDQTELVKENEILSTEKDQLELTVSELCKANAALEEELNQVQTDLQNVQNRMESSSLANGETETKQKVVKTTSDNKPEKSLKIKSLQTQISHLQQQLSEFDRQHQDIVSVYRTHLISAVQGHMDPDVKQALHHIIELRSMEQFC